MKFLIPIFLLLSIHASATNYYVSATGSDGAAGTSPGTAWQSIAKVNAAMSSMSNGDSILFKKGDTFFGTLKLTKQLKIDAYGTGVSPVIYGYSQLSSWTETSTNIWEASLTAAGNLNLVTVNGRPQTIARTPNLDNGEGGYRFYRYAGTTGSNMYIVDTASTKIASVGDDVYARINEFRIVHGKVYRVAGDSIYLRMSYSLNSSVTPQWGTIKNGFAYCVANNVAFLDKQWEWFNDTVSHKLKLYSTVDPNTLTIRASIKDTGINCNGQSNVSIKNIDFEGFNCYSIWNKNATNITIDNVTINNCGGDGTLVLNVPPTNINDVRVTNSLSYGIQVYNKNVNTTNITNCIVTNTGLIPGMGSFFDGREYTHISSNSNFLTMQYNSVDSSGYCGFEFQGNDVILSKNTASNAGNVLMDHGLFYTYMGETDATSYSRRLLSNNFAFYSGANLYGTGQSKGDGVGFYMDGRTQNVTLQNNWSVGNYIGMQLNNPDSIRVLNNYFIDNKNNSVSFTKLGTPGTYDTMKNNILKGNIFYQRNAGRYNYNMFFTGANMYSDLATEIKRFGVIDSNYYCNVNQLGFGMDLYSPTAPILWHPYSLASWQSEFGFDAHSSYIRDPQYYSLGSFIGSNLIANSNFATGSGWNVNGTNTIVTFINSASFAFSSPVPNRWSNINRNIGAVSSSKKYVVRFTITGASVNGALEVYLRNSVSPNADLVIRQYRAFTTVPQDVEFVFNPTTSSSAQLVLSLNQYSGSGTKINNVIMYEVPVTTFNTQDSIISLYNYTTGSSSVDLPYQYQIPQGSIYSTAPMPTYTGFFGNYYAPLSVIPPSPVSLTTSSTDATCFNLANGSATVSATGGTGVYSYNWSTGDTTATVNGLIAGTYTITVTSGSSSSIGTVVVGSPTELAAYASITAQVGDTATVSITATGGTGAYTGTGSFSQGVGESKYTVTDANGCSATVLVTVTSYKKIYLRHIKGVIKI